MSLFLSRRFFVVAILLIALFVLGYTIPAVYVLARVLLWVWVGLCVLEAILLYAVPSRRMQAERHCAERFSNGDPNEVLIDVTSPYAFPVRVQVADEAPVDFQLRDFVMQRMLSARQSVTLRYTLTPHHRGAYRFDHIRLFFSTPLGMVERRYTRGTPVAVKVYPSFAHLSLYSLMCTHRLDEYGIKRVRQVGSDTDFEQIKDYVAGDEFRSINWKASARVHSLKVNVYQQDRSMPVYCIVDKGRMMQQSACGLTFFEHSVNAALALAYVAIRKDDQAGLVTLGAEVDAFVPARRHETQMPLLMEALYRQETTFPECDYSSLSTFFTQRVTKRSLAILFANFSTLNALDRELPHLLHIAHRHQLLVVMFRDREMEAFVARQPVNTEEYYQQISVEKYNRERLLIIRRLRQNNILTLYTLPEQLSVGIINSYLEYRHF